MHWLPVAGSGGGPGPRCGAVAAIVGRKLFVSGGWSTAAGVEYLDDVWSIDTTTAQWERHAASGSAAGPPRHGPQTAQWHGGVLLCWAGHGVEYFRNTLWILDPRAGRQWVRQQPRWRSPGLASYIDDAAQTVDASRGPVVFGGEDGSYSAKLQHLDPRTWGWSLASAHGDGPTPRHSHAAALDLRERRLYVVGGHDGRSCGDAYCLQMGQRRMRWARVDAPGPASPPRVCGGAWCNSGRLYCYGGFYGGTYHKGVSVLDYGAGGDEWVPTRCAEPAPRARSGAACAGFDRDTPSDSGMASRIMFVFGGYDGKEYLSDLHVLQDG